MEGASGTPITTLEQWGRERQRLRSEFAHWVYRKMSPPPDNLRAMVTGTRGDGGVTVREVRLEFEPDHRGILHVHLFIPDGKAPFPVFLTNQPRTSSWIKLAIRRGYSAYIYDATDPIFGATDDCDTFIDLYPDYDFACIARFLEAPAQMCGVCCTYPSPPGFQPSAPFESPLVRCMGVA